MDLKPFVREGQPYDFHHGLFPGVPHEQMQQEWSDLGVTVAPEMVRVLYNHIKTLPIPGAGQVALINLLPDHFGVMLAEAIDHYATTWNIVQRTAVWIAMQKELYKAANHAWICHISGQPFPATPGEHIGDQMLNELFKKPDSLT